MVYEVIEYLTGKPTFFDADTNPNAFAEAEALLATYRAEVLALPNIELQFTILRVVPVEGGEKWEPADLSTDPEEGDFQVLDYHTGQYTFYDFKSEAIAAMEVLKQQFLVENHLDKPIELPSMPPPRPTPSTHDN